jgi:hypothetical protein
MNCIVFDAQVPCESCGLRHPGYPLPRACPSGKDFQQRNQFGAGNGTCRAGTELKSLLAGWPFRIVATADCKCTSRAAYMDAKGCDWCESEEGMDEIMGFLREAAEERGLPFLDVAARLLVRRAIHNARKAEAARAREAERPPLHTEQ